MKTNLIILAIAALIISGCNKDKALVEPTSSFSFLNGTRNTIIVDNTIKVATLDSFALVNNSLNADSTLWDFGDGRTSTKKDLYVSYPKSGKYTIKLTAKTSNGQKSTSSKEVVVLDRVLKSICVQTAQWDTVNTDGWPTSSKADIYFQIQKFTDLSVIQYSVYPNCPVIYTSPVVKNVGYATHTAFTIYVNEKVIIDKSLLQWAIPEYLNKTYLFSLMAKDSNGKVYCLQNNQGGGGYYFGIMIDDLTANKFVIQNGPFSAILLNCDFE